MWGRAPWRGHWITRPRGDLFRFDEAFGRTAVANLGNPYAAVAYVGDAVVGVPAPGSLALLAAALMGGLALRRRAA